MKSANFPLWLIPVIFPLYFAFLWVFVTFLISRMGWNRLSGFVVQPQTVVDRSRGRTFGMSGARIGKANYNNCLTIIVTSNGLYVCPIILFKLFHPPLLIPWGAFSPPVSRQVLWANVVEYMISTPQGDHVRLTFHSKVLVEAIEVARLETSQSPFSDLPL